ncbi:siderophore-interacting protein [Desertivirga arenae]|uniref:siderophore-interacting protein n=1 Tax=Desertivirga arenae TaxID=2810309 RepID=UPI001A97267A|nr:siderophore-interacting protein [Pedobacter sp. SYSU D00823]
MATVSRVEYLHPKLKQVTFTGDFSGIIFKVGFAIAFRVTERDFRNYSPNFFDSEKGMCEVIFHLHGKGPGSRFAEELKTGDIVRLIEPRGKQMYHPEASRHFLFGDETTISLYCSLASVIESNNQTYDGIIELSDLDSIPEQLGLQLQVVKKGTQPAEFLTKRLKSWELESPALWRDAAFYVTGNAQSIQVIVKELKCFGVKPKQIITQAFWANGKVGL